ncbi:hypothetical protein GCM10022229_00640 [Luteimonas lutimaris]|uniref:Uncharacterized protein n=1 Tax=Luteimonas lutimaris TaxID=698645 RepID=A0ABP7M1Q9_9GAMM
MGGLWQVGDEEEVGLGARDSGLGTRDAGLGTRDPGLGTRDPGKAWLLRDCHSRESGALNRRLSGQPVAFRRTRFPSQGGLGFPLSRE